jgi:hypothetical protein
LKNALFLSTPSSTTPILMPSPRIPVEASRVVAPISPVLSFRFGR